LQEGIPLIEAVKKAKYLFPGRYLPYLEQGEKCRAMPSMFGLMQKQYRDHLVLKGNIAGMALYPAVVWSIAVICFATMKIYVEPVFVKMFQESQIGWSATRPIFEIAFLLSAGLFLVWRLYPRLVQGNYLRRIYESLPYFGRAFHYRFWTEFTRVLGQLLAQGVAVPEAVEAAGGVMAGQAVQEAARRAAGRNREGNKLSQALREEGYFPASLVWTAAQGELIGNLPGALRLLAERYERARDHYSENSYRVLEVIFTFLLALGIGYMILRYYSILFSFTLPFA
jgi:type IV pilus assembly protein PilC